MLTMLSGQVMSAPSVLALATIFFPCRALSEASPPPNSPSMAAANQLSHLHTRLKRGWIWKQLFVPEEDPTPRVVGQLKSDYDRGDFSIRYVLSGEGAGDIFQMDEYSGEIRTLRRLDREEKAFYVLQAQAVSRGSGEPVEPQSEFIVKVQDVNDNAPRFQNEPYVASVPEMCPVGTTVVQVTATDADDPLFGNNAKLIYSILQGEPYFSVEAKTGIIVTSWPDMDREARDQYLVVVQVKDMLGLSGGYSASTTVTVSLTDINDNGPMFQHHQYTFSVREDAAVGMTVGRIMAKDGDTGINARMNYSLDDLEESATFTIHTDPATQEGVVVLAKELKRVIICLPLTTSQVVLVMTAKVMQEQPLDYESKRRFVMAAEASNEEQADARYLGDGESRDRTTLKVVVDDVDEAPVFLAPLYEWKVPENAAPGTAVGVVCARDVDAANNPVRYSFDKSSDTGKAFKIDPNNGTVTVANPLDRETANWHNLTAVAKETKQNHLSSSVVVLIKVLDINDNVPRLARDYRPYICEDTQAGEVIQLLSAVDPDEPVEGHHFYFSMVYEKHINPNFTIRDNQDNTAGVVARHSTFTLEDRALYLLPVVVRDSGSPALSSTATLSVTVCRCQPAGHCPSGGVEALALPLGLSLWTLLGLLLGLATLAALSVLMLLLRRHQQKPQEGPPGVAVGVGGGGKELEELAADVLSQKVLRYEEPPAGGARGPGGSVPPPDPVVPLRPRPRKRERLRREDVAASIRMSLRHSQLGAAVGPDDELFRRFVADRLAEADGDPCVPPHDCLRTYAYEGTGSSAGSLSSIESLELAAPEPKPETGPATGQPTAPPARSCLVRLSPWCGAAGEETTF